MEKYLYALKLSKILGLSSTQTYRCKSVL